MNRIDAKFQELKRKRRKAFIAFITAGDPVLRTTEALVPALAQAGADIVELGVPFSDPLADGPVIQASSQRALTHHVTIEKIFQSVKRIRRKCDVPIAFMTYYNPVFHYGEERFVARAKRAGVDGLIVPDLPPEEAIALKQACRKQNISLVFFLSPTTTPSRAKIITQASTGFVYYVSLTGVTGARNTLPKTIADQVRKAKAGTSKPVCVGFGVSTAAQVKALSRVADGVIVGSAIVKEIRKHEGKKDLLKRVSRLVSGLSRGL